jgi:hypothetical protein
MRPRGPLLALPPCAASLPPASAGCFHLQLHLTPLTWFTRGACSRPRPLPPCRYLLKLFRDYVFHTWEADRRPVVDFGAVVQVKPSCCNNNSCNKTAATRTAQSAKARGGLEGVLREPR